MSAKNPNSVVVPGSERQPMPHARARGAAPPEQTIRVTVLVRRRVDGGDMALHAHLALANTVSAPMAAPEFVARFGADPADFAQIAAFAADHGLRVVDSRPAERRIVLEGTACALSAAFDVTLEEYADDQTGIAYRGRRGPVHVPASLAAIIEGVFGLDDRPQARPHFRLRPPEPTDSTIRHARLARVSYTPPQLAAAYDFPAVGQGNGQCIGIIELGGGYRQADLDAYFEQLGVPSPHVVSKPVDGGHNRPVGDASSADGEVLLDIEVVGAIAPAALLVVYFAPNTDAGFLDAISSAIHDATHKPSVISISWGGPESSWTAQAMRAMDAVFQDAAALGVTVCCAAGDDGSSDQRAPAADDGGVHVDFPASSPFALACGGTRLDATGSGWRETVWNAGRGGGGTGGGVSEVFARPGWQDAANVPPSVNPGHHIGRGVPDVAANADPATGYVIRVDGQQMVIGGTSAVAPLYAALVALCNEQLGRRLGYLNPVLYRLPSSSQAFRDVGSGDNDITGGHGAYSAGAGWDACTGLGSVRGAQLLAALKRA